MDLENGIERLRAQLDFSPFAIPSRLRDSYVEFNQERFYFSSSCSQDEERSNESCGHDQRPTTDRVLACNGRREAWFKPLACHSARTDA
jgi:hypothetical protein